MKKSLLALAVLSAYAGIANAQSNVTIYGRVDMGLSHFDKVAIAGTRTTGSRIAAESGLGTASRFGIMGEEDLGGGLKAQFGLEGGLNIANGSQTQGGRLFGRKSVVGFKGANFGDLQVGYRKTFGDEVHAVYSFAQQINWATKVHGNNLDQYGGNRSENMIYYTTPTVNGFRANVTYGFGGIVGNTAAGRQMGVGANWANGPFGIGFAYSRTQLGNVTAAGNVNADAAAAVAAGCNSVGVGAPGDVCLKSWVLGSSYDFGPVRLHGSWSQTNQPLARAGGAAPAFATTFAPATSAAGAAGNFTAGGLNNEKFNVLDVSLDYKVNDKVTLYGGVIQSRYNFVGANATGKLTQFTLMGQYSLSKRTRLYGIFANLRASNMYSPGISVAPGVDNTQNGFAVGVSHFF